MLAEITRFWIVNKTGIAIPFSGASTFTLTSKPKKITDGELAYGAEETWFPSPSGDLADNAAVASATTVDNTTGKYLEADCVARLNSAAVMAGNLEIRYEVSTDGGVTWPSSAANFDAERDLRLKKVIDASGGAGDRSVDFRMS